MIFFLCGLKFGLTFNYVCKEDNPPMYPRPAPIKEFSTLVFRNIRFIKIFTTNRFLTLISFSIYVPHVILNSMVPSDAAPNIIWNLRLHFLTILEPHISQPKHGWKYSPGLFDYRNFLRLLSSMSLRGNTLIYVSRKKEIGIIEGITGFQPPYFPEFHFLTFLCYLKIFI